MNTSAHSNARAIKPRRLTTLESARMQMAYIWTYGTIALLVVLAIHTISVPQYAQEIWTWALPTIMPTAGLIFSVMASTALVQPGEKETPIFVRRGFFGLARIVSVFYLLALGLWVLLGANLVAQQIAPAVAQGFRAATAGATNVPPRSEFVQGLMVGNYFLSPLQSLVIGVMGALFFTKDKEAKPGTTASAGEHASDAPAAAVAAPQSTPA